MLQVKSLSCSTCIQAPRFFSGLEKISGLSGYIIIVCVCVCVNWAYLKISVYLNVQVSNRYPLDLTNHKCVCMHTYIYTPHSEKETLIQRKGSKKWSLKKSCCQLMWRKDSTVPQPNGQLSPQNIFLHDGDTASTSSAVESWGLVHTHTQCHNIKIYIVHLKYHNEEETRTKPAKRKALISLIRKIRI